MAEERFEDDAQRLNDAASATTQIASHAARYASSTAGTAAGSAAGTAAGTAAGATSGAATGATVGSAAGPLGTAAGATIGAFIKPILITIITVVVLITILVTTIEAYIWSIVTSIPSAIIGGIKSIFVREQVQVTDIITSLYTEPSIKNSSDLVTYCHQAAAENWGYCSGTFGWVLTEPILKQKLEQYPEKVKPHYEQARTWIGSRTTDCLGLIKGYMWYDTEKSKYVVYSNDFPDYSISQIKAAADFYGTIDTIPEIPGLAVWRSDHVGVYVGNGKVIHSNGYYRGVEMTDVDSIYDAWEYWFPIPGLSYDIEAYDPSKELEDLPEAEDIDKASHIVFPSLNLDALFMAEEFNTYLTDYINSACDMIGTVLESRTNETEEDIEKEFERNDQQTEYDTYDIKYYFDDPKFGLDKFELICAWSAREYEPDNPNATGLDDINIQSMLRKLYKSYDDIVYYTVNQLPDVKTTLETYEVAILDEEGQPVLDEHGNPKTRTELKWVPHDCWHFIYNVYTISQEQIEKKYFGLDDTHYDYIPEIISNLSDLMILMGAAEAEK